MNTSTVKNKKINSGLTLNKKFLSLVTSLFFILPLNLFASHTIIDDFIEQEQKSYTFYGMASYYNNFSYYIINNEKILQIDTPNEVKMQASEWLAIVSRFDVMLIQKSGLLVKIKNDKLIIDNHDMLSHKDTVVKTVTKDKLTTIAPELDQLRYYHLWAPLAWLSKIIESILVLIQTYLVSNWGIVIIVFAVLLKLLLLPIGIMTANFQRKVSQVQSYLTPKLAEIKANYDGEEAHNRLMSEHKELGVSPFYTLKPIFGSFIQIPILIATFNALGEMSQFDGESFLWIANLAYPDAVMHLSFSVLMFGNSINLLPFLMTIITIYSTIVFQNKHAPEAEVKRQKRNLYFMAFAFFVLFYPFPAVMVLYWVLANILQFIQQKYVDV